MSRFAFPTILPSASAPSASLSAARSKPLALEEFRLGHLTKPELRRLLGFGTRDALDGFLKAHDMLALDAPVDLGPALASVPEAPDEETQARARQAAANIIARRKGVTLGGLSLKDLINEGRP
jgi:hypothetical protein